MGSKTEPRASEESEHAATVPQNVDAISLISVVDYVANGSV